MKIIFLDIDGVLNGDLTHSERNPYGILIDDTRLDLIKHIIDKTGAKIVLSTSWKEHWEKSDDKCDEIGREIRRRFEEKEISILDKTPKRWNDRKQEIVDWLEEHSEVTSFVVMDDTPFEEGILKQHFVLTSSFRYGIDEFDMEKAISILNSRFGSILS